MHKVEMSWGKTRAAGGVKTWVGKTIEPSEEGENGIKLRLQRPFGVG